MAYKGPCIDVLIDEIDGLFPIGMLVYGMCTDSGNATGHLEAGSDLPAFGNVAVLALVHECTQRILSSLLFHSAQSAASYCVFKPGPMIIADGWHSSNSLCAYYTMW